MIQEQTYDVWFTELLARCGKPKSALREDEWYRLTVLMNTAIEAVWSLDYNFDALSVLAPVDVYGSYPSPSGDEPAYEASAFIPRIISGNNGKSYIVGRMRAVYASDPCVTARPTLFEYRVTPDGFIPFCDDAKRVWISFVRACPEISFSIDNWDINKAYEAMSKIELPRFIKPYVLYRAWMDEFCANGNRDYEWFDRCNRKAEDILESLILADQKESGVLSWGIVVRRNFVRDSQKFSGNERGSKLIPYELDLWDILPEWIDVNGVQDSGLWVYTLDMANYGSWAERYVRVSVDKEYDGNGAEIPFELGYGSGKRR